MDFAELTAWQWAALCASGVLLGINRAGMPGLGILVVPLLAIAFAAKASTGILLPLLITADLFGVIYHRKNVQFRYIARLLPATVMGIGVGAWLLTRLGNVDIGPLIGLIVLGLLGVNYWRSRLQDNIDNVPHHWAFAGSLGLLAGITTQLANAAGPIMVIYCLSMRLEKRHFVGTHVWFFAILNWIKLPLFIWDGRVNWQSASLDLVAIPFIAIGAGLGVLLLKYIPQKWFLIAVQVLAAAAGIKLAGGFL